jgi:hypothetical protein
MRKKTLLKPMKTRHYAELARLENALGMKVRPGVTNIGRPRVGTIINPVPMSEGLAEEASVSVASRRAAKREEPMQSAVVGVDDVVGDEDDDTSDEGMVDKDIEDGEIGDDQEGSSWTPRLS